jgi:hypothetical protein
MRSSRDKHFHTTGLNLSLADGAKTSRFTDRFFTCVRYSKDNQANEVNEMTQRIPVRIVSIQGQTIYGVEEDGHITRVFLTPKQEDDPLYLRILHRIQQSQLWLAMNPRHQLMDNGWL